MSDPGSSRPPTGLPGGSWTPPPAPPGQQPPPPGPWGQQLPPPGSWGQQPAQPYQFGQPPQAYVPLATPGKRILARIVDGLVMFAAVIPLYFGVLLAAGSTTTTDFDGDPVVPGMAFGGMLLLILAVTVGQVLYEVGFIALKGATPGKMLLHIRVVREVDHQIPGWGPAFLRWVPNLVSLVPCVGGLLGLGLWIWALVNLFSHPKRQTPFDLAARTIVISRD